MPVFLAFSEGSDMVLEPPGNKSNLEPRNPKGNRLTGLRNAIRTNRQRRGPPDPGNADGWGGGDTPDPGSSGVGAAPRWRGQDVALKPHPPAWLAPRRCLADSWHRRQSLRKVKVGGDAVRGRIVRR